MPGAKVVMPGDDFNPNTISQHPEENPREVKDQMDGLEMARRDMSPQERLEKAEETKLQANEHFGNGKWKTSMVGYLAAIWFLKRGCPPCPVMVCSSVRGLDEVATQLGAGNVIHASLSVAAESELAGVAPLRLACHLNLAQAALKMSEWSIAKAACEWVLGAADASNPKALFRLAKAYEGEGASRCDEITRSRCSLTPPAAANIRRLHR